MKTPEYKDLVNELIDLCRLDNDRFWKFYRKVTNVIASIPEGDIIDIRCHVSVKSIDTFRKIAYLYMLDMNAHAKVNDDYYEVVDEYHIKHVATFRPSISRKFYR